MGAWPARARTSTRSATSSSPTRTRTTRRCARRGPSSGSSATACSRWRATPKCCAALDDWQHVLLEPRRRAHATSRAKTPWRPPSLVLEADPPLHTRTRGVLWRAMSGPALERSAPTLRRDGRAPRRRARRARRIDANRDLAESVRAERLPRRGRARRGRPREPPALRRHGVQRVRPAQPRCSRSRSPNAAEGRRVDRRAVRARARCVAGGLGAHVYAEADAGEVSEDEAALLVRSHADRGPRHDDRRHQRRHPLLRDEPRPVAAAARGAVAPARRVRRGHAPRLAGADLLPDDDPRGRGRRHQARRGPEGAPVPRRREPRSAQVAAIPTASTSGGAALATSPSATECTCASARCWRAWRPSSCSPRSRSEWRRSKRAAQPTWRLNNTLRAIEHLPVALVPV